MVLPAQALDWRTIAAAMGVYPFCRVDLAEIARPDLLGRRQLALDQRRGCGLAEPSERARDLFFRRVVRWYDGRRRLDADREVLRPVPSSRGNDPGSPPARRPSMHQSLNCATPVPPGH
jgi:hypothetical protein